MGRKAKQKREKEEQQEAELRGKHIRKRRRQEVKEIRKEQKKAERGARRGHEKKLSPSLLKADGTSHVFIHQAQSTPARQNISQQADAIISENDADGFIELYPAFDVFSPQKSEERHGASSEKKKVVDLPPWIPEGKKYTAQHALLNLHEEILDFCDFISPSLEEKQQRADVFEELSTMIKKLWPTAQVDMHGSQATDLYLPTSDIDVMVNIPGDTAASQVMHLQCLATQLERQGVPSYLEVIAKARIPIVKYTHKQTGINVDVCFGVDSGARTAALIRKFMSRMSPLRPLVLVLKQFLMQRGLNETFTGGVGSFLLQLMVISFLQQFQRQWFKTPVAERPIVSLGLLLVEFLKLYGEDLNYVTTGLSVLHSGTYYSKEEEQRLNNGRPFLLSVENPDDPTLDVSANSFEIRQVRRIFLYAYNRLRGQLHRAAGEPSRYFKYNGSLLAHIIALDDSIVARFHHQGKPFGFEPLEFGALEDESKEQGRERAFGNHERQMSSGKPTPSRFRRKRHRGKNI